MERRHDDRHLVRAPHFPTVISQEDVRALLLIVSDDDVPFSRIAAELDHRPALSSFLLRLANSVTVAATQQVVSIRHAIAILGLVRTREALWSLLDVDEVRQQRTGA